jgi:hypothetical protein
MSVPDGPQAWQNLVGLRVGSLALVRYTEQTAILMALVEGRHLEFSHIEWLATASLGACLLKSPYHMRVVSRSPKHDLNTSNLWVEMGFLARPSKGTDAGSRGTLAPKEVRGADWPRVSGSNAFGVASPLADPPPRDRDPFALDLVVSPVDGKRALRDGLAGGTAVTLAAGPPGSFPAERQITTNEGVVEVTPELSYLLLVIGPERAQQLREHAGTFAGNASIELSCLNPTPGLATVPRRRTRRSAGRVENDRVIYDLVASVLSGPWLRTNRDGAPTIALLDEWGLKFWREAAERAGPCRTFVGSSVALATAVLRERAGLDIMLAVVGHTHVSQIAVAAHATGGEIIAVPLDLRLNSDSTHVEMVRPRGNWGLTKASFASSDTLLVASGISQHLLFGGVRRKRPARPRVDSVMLSARTGSFRTFEHELDMNKCRFCSWNPREIGSDSKARKLPLLWDQGLRIHAEFEKAIATFLAHDHALQVASARRAKPK